MPYVLYGRDVRGLYSALEILLEEMLVKSHEAISTSLLYVAKCMESHVMV